MINNLRERIYKYALQNVELKTDAKLSWKDLKPLKIKKEKL